MLRIHFLNVGHGDCTVIKHPSGRLTMIDINNSQEFDADTFNEELEEETRKRRHSASTGLGALSPSRSLLGDLLSPTRGSLGDLSAFSDFAAADSAVKARQTVELEDPIDFVKRTYPGETLWRFILTHPDLDHMRGIKNLSENIGFTNFWDTNHTKPAPRFRGPADQEDWEFYQSIRSNAKNYTRGASLYAFGKEENGQAGGDRIEILSPTPALVDACNKAGKSNDLSLVLRVWHGQESVLLGADAEAAAWKDMREAYGAGLKSSFLKASHHGRDSGYDVDAVKLIDPIMTFVSVGLKPDTDASYKYRQLTGQKVASTRFYGNIELRLNDNGTSQWFVDRNEDKS